MMLGFGTWVALLPCAWAKLAGPSTHCFTIRPWCCRNALGKHDSTHGQRSEIVCRLLTSLQLEFIMQFKPPSPPALTSSCFIRRMFGGELLSRITCVHGGVSQVSEQHQTFCSLLLATSGASSVQQALQAFTQLHVLDGDNSYRCVRQIRSDACPTDA